MKREMSDAKLSAVFVDYDNIYLSLRRKNEEAAKRFAKDTGKWLAAMASGELITGSSARALSGERRLVMNRCYGNPVPRRNQGDNSTDMNSFPFVRHYFLKNGFEIVDCPPLTAQLKNSSDIKMVMDLRDFLNHDTYFNEFIILSSDADFTPVLHRLRAHDRRTVIFSNDNTAAPYTALADGFVRDADLISLLLSDQVADETAEVAIASDASNATTNTRAEIVAEAITLVKEASQPVPLETLAQMVTRALTADKTIGSSWGGIGDFHTLLSQYLPDDVRITPNAPFIVYDNDRLEKANSNPALEADRQRPSLAAPAASSEATMEVADQAQQMAAEASSSANQEDKLQESIARIHEASQVPPLSPPDYTAIFEELAADLSQNQLQGVQTIANLVERVKARGVALKAEDARFILDIVSEADPWFEQGASATLFAGRFRNFVVARCRSQGLTLSSEELDLIEMWFAGGATTPATAQQQTTTQAGSAETSQDTAYGSGSLGLGLQDDMPRFVRSQARG